MIKEQQIKNFLADSNLICVQFQQEVSSHGDTKKIVIVRSYHTYRYRKCLYCDEVEPVLDVSVYGAHTHTQFIKVNFERGIWGCYCGALWQEDEKRLKEK